MVTRADLQRKPNPDLHHGDHAVVHSHQNPFYDGISVTLVRRDDTWGEWYWIVLSNEQKHSGLRETSVEIGMELWFSEKYLRPARPRPTTMRSAVSL